MANSNSNDNDGDERNPFVAFRHFADESIGAALSALTGANADMWKRLEDAEGDARKAWKRFNESYERATSPERRRTERDGDEKLSSISSPANTVRQQQEWGSAREERDLPWSGWGPDHWPAIRFGFDRFFDRPGPWRPNLEFLARNRYSPLVLEQRYPTEQQGTKWRLAFEDLLKTENGEDTSGAGMKYVADKNEQPEDWLRRMISKELVTIRRDPWFWVEEPRYPGACPRDWGHGSHGSSWRSSKRTMKDEKKKDADTELDLYEHFLGDRSSTPAHQIQAKMEEEAIPKINSDNKPSVIATMTTTEQRMLPDGTVTTKTVLKKKFSDGTEESQETHNTIPGVEYREQPALSMPQVNVRAEITDKAEVREKAEVKGNPEVNVEKPKANKMNWFWS